ncbi:MAG: PAS domain S-box protein, partial [Elusimicrobia bacterium]|nr:PAS domain S-box protein [Elusimicrobiota bacterium]
MAPHRCQTLQGGAHLYQRIFREIREAIFVLDARTYRVIDANPAAERLFGHPRSRLLRLTLPQLTSNPRHAREVLAHFVAGTQQRLPERVAVKADGSRFPVAVALSDFACCGRRMLVSVLRDLTEQRRARQWEQMRTRATFLRECLMAVSHEVRTPIATIKTFAELLRDAPGGPVSRRFIRVILRQTDRLAALVDRILDLGAIDARLRRRRAKPTALAAALRASIDNLQAFAESREITVLLDVPAGLSVSIDRLDLSRALQNLLENAIKHNRRGGLVLIRAHRVGAEVILGVADDGPGVPRSELPHLFERLRRGARARRLGIPGSGLGLALVRELVEGNG